MRAALPAGLISISNTEAEHVPLDDADLRHENLTALYKFWKGELGWVCL